ncbi:hypothetical protein CMQ_5613 [Grosmannia clavigera kw1407]|uniref:Myb/SANT-like domain-containing protein n=1 Tax=Grosmannia clavigera (strain kw1407 / UAMH 11150) TaxID=655863 RepID=F0XT60_GROCL|nr:uncharacterized protein CMQ_5613 [Grosmannia clavigera kw1407]EFW99192.1 hypothetical protein CMQ_5613 [Grosmannia clavigera kw1407]
MSEDESPRSDPHSSVPAALLPWQKKPRFSWTPAYETTFFQSLCQSVQLGLRENQSFKQEAWNRALVALREQGAYPTKPHLINKTDNARKKFRLWRGLVENPQFTYNPVTKTITGSEEAWQAHLEKEPLARAFRERPFDNAEYLEVLFPDVVGSRGHPKRVTRPRRKGPDSLPDNEAAPGTGIMRLQNGPGNVHMNQNILTPTVGSTPIPVPSNVQVRQQVAASTGAAVQMRSAQGSVSGGVSGPTSTTIQPPPPPGTTRQLPGGGSGIGGVGGIGGGGTNRVGNAVSASALTPPEEVGTVGQQKRFAPGTDGAQTLSKRRRTEGSINAAGNNSAAHRNRSETYASAVGGGAGAGGTGPLSVAAVAAGAAGAVARAAGGQGVDAALSGMRQAQPGGLSTAASRIDGIAGLLSDVLTKYASATSLASTTRWPEQALEIFFQEFADEDMDLQLRIAEKILTDTSKAVMFCKMPSTLRKHWVKRLREVSNRLGS